MTLETGASRADQVEKRPFYRLLLLHHTHWDREWWATFQDFRIRLVALIDQLLDTLDADPGFRNFLLDSQTIVVKDYLEVRPENRDRFLNYIRDGRIQCGPWHILPDEFLVSAESHVRNLWLGRRTARELAIPLQVVGYLPDTFGHIGQMPQILRGFGIDNAFMWRGRGGDPQSIKQEYLWQSPDGSEVLAYWFPDGYGQTPFLHFGNPDRSYEDKLGRIFASIERWGPRATTDVLLLPYGDDHLLIDPDLPAKVAEANEAIKEIGVIEWATTSEFIAAVREGNPSLQTVKGELREFGLNHPYMLPAVLSTRMYLKQANFSCQTWLERYAEPFSALAWLRGHKYDSGLLWKAWELLIQNHPHDSICGCSIDQVHRENVVRFDQSRQIAQILTEHSIQHLNTQIDTSCIAAQDRAFVVHNPLAWGRSGFSTAWVPRSGNTSTLISPGTHQLFDSEGVEVPFQVRNIDQQRLTEDRFEYTEIGFVAVAVPGFGYRTYRLTQRETPLNSRRLAFTAVQPTAKYKGPDRLTDLAVGDNVLENEFLRVEVDPRNGTLAVTDKTSGETYRGLNAFEDGGDSGDEYNYSQPLNDTVLRSDQSAQVHVTVAEAGFARATLRVDLFWSIPAELAADRLSRTPAYEDKRISTFVSLAASSRRVDISTEWENRSKDHRLRALFPLGADVNVAHAQGHFEVSHRPVVVDEPGRGWAEPYVPTMPQQGWVSVDDGTRGLTIANRGLPEFEILPDGVGTIAITVLRAVGWLSREDFLSRTGHAGPQLPTPEAQCLGKNRAAYSIIPHLGNWLAARSYLIADEYLVPLYGSVTDAHSGELPLNGGMVELLGEHTLVLSSCKKAEDGDGLILRFWNLAQEATQARVRAPLTLIGGDSGVEVRLVDLKEEPLGGDVLPMDKDGTFVLRAGPSKIVTVAIGRVPIPEL
jgi:mannosylglycerate hydrolase